MLTEFDVWTPLGSFAKPATEFDPTFCTTNASPSPPSTAPPMDPRLLNWNWKRVSKPLPHGCLVCAHDSPNIPVPAGVRRKALPLGAATPTIFSPAVELKLAKLIGEGTMAGS